MTMEATRARSVRRPPARLSVTVAVFLLGACSGDSGTAGRTQAGSAPTIRPSPPDMQAEALCILRPTSILKMKSAVSGEVQRVLVRPGDRVEPGQVLVQIDTRDLALRRQRLVLSRDRASSQTRLMTIQRERLQREFKAAASLYSDAAKAREADLLREKELEVHQAELSVKDFELQIAELDRSIAQSTLRAPGAGTILSRSVEPGQVIGAAIGVASGGEVLLELGDTAHLMLDCVVAEADALRLRLGDSMLLRRGNGERHEIRARIIRLSPTIENQGGVPQFRFQAELTGDGSDGETLIVGMRMVALIGDPVRRP